VLKKHPYAMESETCIALLPVEYGGIYDTREVKARIGAKQTPVEAPCPIGIYGTKQNLKILIFLSTTPTKSRV
jgi:hypothetical protein